MYSIITNLIYHKIIIKLNSNYYLRELKRKKRRRKKILDKTILLVYLPEVVQFLLLPVVGADDLLLPRHRLTCAWPLPWSYRVSLLLWMISETIQRRQPRPFHLRQILLPFLVHRHPKSSTTLQHLPRRRYKINITPILEDKGNELQIGHVLHDYIWLIYFYHLYKHIFNSYIIMNIIILCILKSYEMI